MGTIQTQTLQSGNQSDINAETVRPYFNSFFKKITAEQWRLLKSSKPDEATTILLADLMLNLMMTISNAVSKQSTNVPVSQERVQSILGNTVKSGFSPGNTKCSKSLDQLTDLVVEEVTETVNSILSASSACVSSGIPSRTINPNKLQEMICYACKTLKADKQIKRLFKSQSHRISHSISSEEQNTTNHSVQKARSSSSSHSSRISSKSEISSEGSPTSSVESVKRIIQETINNSLTDITTFFNEFNDSLKLNASISREIYEALDDIIESILKEGKKGKESQEPSSSIRKGMRTINRLFIKTFASAGTLQILTQVAKKFKKETEFKSRQAITSLIASIDAVLLKQEKQGGGNESCASQTLKKPTSEKVIAFTKQLSDLIYEHIIPGKIAEPSSSPVAVPKAHKGMYADIQTRVFCFLSLISWWLNNQVNSHTDRVTEALNAIDSMETSSEISSIEENTPRQSISSEISSIEGDKPRQSISSEISSRGKKRSKQSTSSEISSIEEDTPRQSTSSEINSRGKKRSKQSTSSEISSIEEDTPRQSTSSEINSRGKKRSKQSTSSEISSIEEDTSRQSISSEINSKRKKISKQSTSSGISSIEEDTSRQSISSEINSRGKKRSKQSTSSEISSNEEKTKNQSTLSGVSSKRKNPSNQSRPSGVNNRKNSTLSQSSSGASSGGRNSSNQPTSSLVSSRGRNSSNQSTSSVVNNRKNSTLSKSSSGASSGGRNSSNQSTSSVVNNRKNSTLSQSSSRASSGGRNSSNQPTSSLVSSRGRNSSNQSTPSLVSSRVRNSSNQSTPSLVSSRGRNSSNQSTRSLVSSRGRNSSNQSISSENVKMFAAERFKMYVRVLVDQLITKIYDNARMTRIGDDIIDISHQLLEGIWAEVKDIDLAVNPQIIKDLDKAIFKELRKKWKPQNLLFAFRLREPELEESIVSSLKRRLRKKRGFLSSFFSNIFSIFKR
ncbi:uncharacterized protein [Paralichthys olivaceus]|uniref:uncharacterized protein n=1 Tax=Paralichthys olivaceus TaxID=8255 RepID=UPI003753D627